eukprot:6199537-Pleurochrysis_carterae.AAC.1
MRVLCHPYQSSTSSLAGHLDCATPLPRVQPSVPALPCALRRRFRATTSDRRGSRCAAERNTRAERRQNRHYSCCLIEKTARAE